MIQVVFTGEVVFVLYFCFSLGKFSSGRNFSNEAGKYLKFTGSGEFPATIIETWQKVWTYFSSEPCKHIRAYAIDFEFYKGPTQVSIYIAIEQLVISAPHLFARGCFGYNTDTTFDQIAPFLHLTPT